MKGSDSDDDDDSGGARSETKRLVTPNGSSSDPAPDDGAPPPPRHIAACSACGDEKVRSRRWLLGAMVLVAGCFGFLFAGYSTLEILATTFHGDLGYYALVCVYAGITPGSFLSPTAVARLGCKRSMLLGAAPYTVFAATNYLVELGVLSGWALLPAGFGVGMGCGALWGAQGLYLVQLSRAYDAMGEEGSTGSLGLFSGAGGAGTPIGGLLALAGSSALMQNAVSNAVIMLFLFIVLGLGNVMLLAVPVAPLSGRAGTEAATRKGEAGKPPAVDSAAIPRLLMSSRQLKLMMVIKPSP